MDKGRMMKCWLLIGVLALTSLLAFGCGQNQGEGPKGKIAIGSDNYSEQAILGEIVAILIEENTDIEVERNLRLGGVPVLHAALKNGNVDGAVEYTGQGWMAVLGEELITDPEQCYQAVKAGYEEQFGIKWFGPLGFNNTYAMTMRREQAEQLELTKASQLQAHQDSLSLGATNEFLERPDGLPGWRVAYDTEFNRTVGMDSGLLYQAVKNGDVDVVTAFSTDGRIPAFDLVILEDDLHFFPPYDAAVIFRQDTLDSYPELEPLLTKLNGQISEEEMASMNAAADLEDQDPEEIARQFLRSKGLIN